MTHNSLVHLINKCDSINCILEKRCVKILWNLFNSDNVLFSRIIRYSMHNSHTTIGENVRYFMYKYKIVYNDWFNDLSNIYNRIDNQIQLIYYWMIFVKLVLSGNYARHVTVVSYNLLTATRCVI